MAQALRKVGTVIGTVASIAAAIPGPHQPVAGAIAVIANATAAVASQLVKPPAAQGAVNERVIGANQPQPYLMGRAYSGGIELHDIGYGGEVDDVQNPYRFLPTLHSCCGPVDGLENVLFDFAPVTFDGSGAATGYYQGYAFRDFQLGQRPEAQALRPHWPGAPGWGDTYRTSSYASLGISLRYSKDGDRFAGGQIPAIGAVWRGVRIYDARQDSTFPGGSGPCRLGNESTYVYSTNPAAQSGMYAYGRYVEGNKVFGVDLGERPIDFSQVVAWSNVCDANGWTIGGTIYEPGDKWNNLKRISQAGGGQPVLTGGNLQFDFQSPRISLHDVVRDDLAEGPISSQRGPSWKTRHNTIVIRTRSEANRWEYPQTGEVSVAEFVAKDGEEKLDEIQYDLVTDDDQGAELGTYEVYQRREEGPFVFTCKPHMRGYRPGHCLTLKAELGLTIGDQKVIIRRRRVNADAGTVTFTCVAETDAKHVAALGSTGTVPPIAYYGTSEALDTVIAANRVSASELRSLIVNRAMIDADPPDGLLQATDASLAVEAHTADYADKAVAVTGGTITTEDDGSTAIAPGTLYHIYYDDLSRSGGAASLQATRTSTVALNSSTNPGRHYVGSITTDVVGGSGVRGGGANPPGWNGDNFYIP